MRVDLKNLRRQLALRVPLLNLLARLPKEIILVPEKMTIKELTYSIILFLIKDKNFVDAVLVLKAKSNVIS